MNVAKSIVWGFTLAVVIFVVILAVGFLFRIDIGVPGFISVTSSRVGAPQSDLQFNPLAPIILTAAFSVAFWLTGLLRARVSKRKGE